MSENSLRIRQKFINNLVNKIAELDENFQLLNQVDRKISRKHRKQHGGAKVELKELQKQALIKRLQIEQQNDDLQKAIKSATDLTAKVTEINEALTQIRSDISGINVKSVNLSGIDVPDIEAIHAKALEQIGAYKLNVVKNDLSGFNDVNGLTNAEMATAKMSVDDYLNLFAEVINSVHGLTLDANDVKIIYRRVAANSGNDPSTKINDTLYQKISTANPTASFASKYSFW